MAMQTQPWSRPSDGQRTHPRSGDLVRRDGRGRGRERPAHHHQRRRQPGRASFGHGRHRARGCRSRPPALDDPRARRSEAPGRHRPLVGTRGRGRDGRPGAGRLAPGRHHHGQDAGVGARPAARAGQPPRGAHIRRMAARPDRGRQARARVPGRGPRRQWRPHLPRAHARPADLHDCSARPSTTRQGRPSTRSAGCSACPTRAAPRS